MLEANVQSLNVKGEVSRCQEGPGELDPTISEKKSLPGIVGLEEMGSNPKL